MVKASQLGPHTKFIKNYGRSGCAILLDRSVNSVIIHSIFDENKSELNGGALILKYLKGFSMSYCLFVRNSAAISGGAIQSTIGAIRITRCTLLNNSAVAAGGAISQDGNKRSKLTLIDVVLKSSNVLSNARGILINTEAFLNFKNVTAVIQTIKNNHTYIEGISAYTYDAQPIHMKTVRFTCPKNYKVLSATTMKPVLLLACQSCPRGKYNLTSEIIHIKDLTRISKNSIKCSLCPKGGYCENYVISKGNFWGYAIKNRLALKIIPCLPTYCCKPGICKTYNGCDNNRTGTLCGSCLKNYRIDIFSNKCINTSDCSVLYFWLLFVTAAIFITVLLVYMKEITTYIRSLVKKTKLHVG